MWLQKSTSLVFCIKNIVWLPIAFFELLNTCFWQPPHYSFLNKWVLVCKELSTVSIPFMRKRRTANKLDCKICILNVSWILKEKSSFIRQFSWNSLGHHLIYKLVQGPLGNLVKISSVGSGVGCINTLKYTL